jgi:pyruvate ferredoxin oxidoreductase alpha subunit
MKLIVTGNGAIAHAVKLCKPKVIAAYPITPQTEIVETLAKFVANGELDAEYIEVESEHSALSACIGAQVTGVRTFTATSSQGLALMHEMLFITSGLRLPIVMAIANRALSAPINIWCDHSDSLAQRDSGWLQFYVENCQEALDTVIQAYRICEDKKVLLPAMVCIDGFVLSHISEPIDIPSQEEVDNFLPDYKPLYKLDPEKPITAGSFSFPNSYMEFKKQQADAMENSKEVIEKVNNEFEKKFGRRYDLIETYKLNNAKTVIIAMGSVCGTIKEVIDKLKGVGLIRIRSFRPFPKEELIKACEGLKNIAVVDRAYSYGFSGILYQEIKACLEDLSTKPKISDFIMGLGGRDIRIEDIEFAIKNAQRERIFWVNVFGGRNI